MVDWANCGASPSPSAWTAGIETRIETINDLDGDGRRPRGRRGLKLNCVAHTRRVLASPSAWTAGIETMRGEVEEDVVVVAVRVDGGD